MEFDASNFDDTVADQLVAVVIDLLTIFVARPELTVSCEEVRGVADAGGGVVEKAVGESAGSEDSALVSAAGEQPIRRRASAQTVNLAIIKNSEFARRRTRRRPGPSRPGQCPMPSVKNARQPVSSASAGKLLANDPGSRAHRL